MANIEKRPLKVFLCHASGDKPVVRDLYKRLTADGVDAWLDQERLLPGQDWRMEIPRAVREADVIVICLSNKSISKEGYVQKEIKFALDIAEEKPDGTIFLIPARLEDCVVPERLNRWQWVDLYENNGFIKLLRSLKLRAEAVDATVEPTSYVDSEKEIGRRLEQLYTEGLAAFYTEDWDKAYQRFQTILSERPNHKNATGKLEEAERQRTLAKLYGQATGAVRSSDWGSAIQTLEELIQNSADYKDAAQLLKNARKQKQLKELYAEAKTLHAAQKWEAIIRVFEQISVIDSNYPDVEDLLPSAQKEVDELQRLAELNDQYSHALREMDAGNWYEARRLLEVIHKSQTGYFETEKLLKTVENQILMEEGQRKQNDQINTLYEQAHGLLRSKKWRNALEKLETIQKLDDHFPDADGIAEKARNELAREEQEAERQNKLAALYAEAVKLLKEEKYQDALDKWQEVKAIDPKYPDRQRVQKTARNALTKQTKPISVKGRFALPKLLWVGLAGAFVIGIIIIIFSILSWSEYRYDNFSSQISDNSINPQLWEIMWSEDLGAGNALIQDGMLILNQSGNNTWLHLRASKYKDIKITEPMFIEARIKILPNYDSWAGIILDGTPEDGYHPYGHCAIRGYMNDTDYLHCYGRDNRMLTRLIVDTGQWHLFRIEIDPIQNNILYIIDGEPVGNDKYIDGMSNIKFSFYLYVWSTNNSMQTAGYFDYVRIGPLE